MSQLGNEQCNQLNPLGVAYMYMFNTSSDNLWTAISFCTNSKSIAYTDMLSYRS